MPLRLAVTSSARQGQVYAFHIWRALTLQSSKTSTAKCEKRKPDPQVLDSRELWQGALHIQVARNRERGEGLEITRATRSPACRP